MSSALLTDHDELTMLEAAVVRAVPAPTAVVRR